MATVSLAKLAISVVSDSKQAVKDLTALQRTMKKVRTKFTTFEAGAISLQGALAGLAGAAGLGLVARQMFEVGSAVAETQSKFSTVFGESTEMVQSFVDEFGVVAGLTNSTAQEILATTGAIAQGMGLAQKASADFATEIVSVAGDLSSFNNIPIAETSRAIQAALTGERESLKRLGIVVREVDVQQRALAMSAKTAASELTQQEKAVATLALIQERAGVAIGDLARTSDSAANRARALGAQLGNIREELATALLPAFGVFLEEMTAGVGGLDGFTESLRGSGQTVAAWARVVVESLKFVGQAFSLVIGGAFDLGQAIGNLGVAWYRLAEGDIRGAIDAAKTAGGEFLQIRDRAMGMVDAFQNIQLASGEAFLTMNNGAREATQQVANLNAQLGAAGEGGLSAAQLEVLNLGVGFRTLGEEAGQVLFKIGEIPETLEPVSTAMNEVEAQGRTFRDTFVNAATESGLSFSRLASTVISELTRMALKASAMGIFNLLTGGAGGFLGGFKSVFGGFFDKGGMIGAGQVGIVGERGPELVRGPAAVTSRQETAALLGGGGGVVNVTLVTAGTGEVVDRVRYQMQRDEDKGREVRIPMKAAVVTP